MILWEDTECLQELVRSVRASTCSSFYKNKYQELTEDFSGSVKKLPFLTRQEIVEVSSKDRLYVDEFEIEQIGFTSGTTSGVPLVAYFSDIKEYFYEPTLNTDARRILIIHPQLSKFAVAVTQMCRQAEVRCTPVFADPSNLANSAVVASLTKCDSLYTTPSLAIHLAPYIKKYSDSGSIKLVAVMSEILTTSQYNEIQKLYPNAKIANIYASAEIGTVILSPCAHLLEKKSKAFHFNRQALASVELVEGELVVTYALNEAFPLIRYKTGDYFEVANESCACGSKYPTISMVGRTGVDLFRAHGLEIRAEVVEDFFKTLPQKFLAYQLHFFENPNDANVIDIEIQIVLEHLSENTDAVEEFVSESFRTSFFCMAKTNIQSLMRAGRIGVVRVKVLDEVSQQSHKAKVLVSHLS